MYKVFLALVFALFVFPLTQVLGQAGPPKKQPLTSTSNQTDRATVMSGSVEPNPEAKSLYEEGVKRVEMGEVSEAVERFQRAVKLDPEYADAYSALGRAFFKLRQWDNASGNLRRAIALRAAKERQRQEVLQKNRGRRIIGGVAPTQRPNDNPVETETRGLVSLTSAQPRKKPIPSSPETRLGETVAVGRTVLRLPPPSPSSTQSETPKNVGTINSSRTIPEPKQAQENNATTGAGTLNSKPEPEVRRVEPAILVNTNADNLQNNALPETIAAVASVKLSTPQLDSVEPDPTPEAAATVKRLSAISDGTLQEILNTDAPSAELFRVKPNGTQQPDAPQYQVTADDPEPLRPRQGQADVQVAMNVPPTLPTIASVSKNLSADEVRLITMYRVGPGDVLDVRLNDSQSRQETAFTVTTSGLLEHPKLSGPLTVRGLTVEEIATKIEADLKNRVLIDNPKALVAVLDYVSHAIVVTGLVKDPGTKVLKREAIPLIVVLADAQPLPEAARVTVERNGVNQIETDLNHTADMNFLVQPGDTVTLQPSITQSFYIGGKVKVPGEKPYRRGLTLLQAIMSAGGATHESKIAEISRNDGQGMLIQTSFDLNDIESGKAADPLVRPGDRILVRR